MIFNLVLIVFTFLVVAMLLLGVPCNSAPHWIPAIVKELYAYGKFSPESFTQRFAAAILVPKRFTCSAPMVKGFYNHKSFV